MKSQASWAVVDRAGNSCYPAEQSRAQWRFIRREGNPGDFDAHFNQRLACRGDTLPAAKARRCVGAGGSENAANEKYVRCTIVEAAVAMHGGGSEGGKGGRI